MSSREKRASLSSGLLTSKDVAPTADARAVPADDVESAAETTPLTPPAVLPATMLSRKGAASAAGFRPDYWSYDREQADRAPAPPPAAPSPAVVPLFAGASPRPAETPPVPTETVAAPTASAASAMEEQTRPSVLILGLGCMAVILSTSLYWLSNSGHGDRAGEPLLPAARVAATRPSEPATPLVAAKPVLPATPEVPAAAAPPSPPAAVSDAVPPRVEAPPGMPAKATAATLSPDEIENLVARGEQLLATGDIVAARLYFQRAAEQGSGAAATGVGKTYDPLFLEQSHVRGVRGDAALAAEWYRKAVAAGDRQAPIRLDHLMQRYPG